MWAGFHNLCPNMAVALYRAFRKGDIAQAASFSKT
jgi:dihydrodipicolinate synthase/N-acetylneuraminate lyase